MDLMDESLYGLYDRQIRLFGHGTQEQIEKSRVCILQGPPYRIERKERVTTIGGEVLKNLVLLGVQKVSVNQHVLGSFKRIFANDVAKINDKVEIDVVDKEDEQECWSGYSLAIFIDQEHEGVDCPGIYICSRCMSFHGVDKKHVCTMYGGISLAHDCLLGAIAVQEWVKKLQGRPFVSEYRLDL